MKERERRQTLEKVNKMIFHDTDAAKAFHGAALHCDVLAERAAQIEFKHQVLASHTCSMRRIPSQCGCSYCTAAACTWHQQPASECCMLHEPHNEESSEPAAAREPKGRRGKRVQIAVMRSAQDEAFQRQLRERVELAEDAEVARLHEAKDRALEQKAAQLAQLDELRRKILEERANNMAEVRLWLACHGRHAETPQRLIASAGVPHVALGMHRGHAWRPYRSSAAARLPQV